MWSGKIELKWGRHLEQLTSKLTRKASYCPAPAFWNSRSRHFNAQTGESLWRWQKSNLSTFCSDVRFIFTCRCTEHGLNFFQCSLSTQLHPIYELLLDGENSTDSLCCRRNIFLSYLAFYLLPSILNPAIFYSSRLNIVDNAHTVRYVLTLIKQKELLMLIYCRQVRFDFPQHL